MYSLEISNMFLRYAVILLLSKRYISSFYNCDYFPKFNFFQHAMIWLNIFLCFIFLMLKGTASQNSLRTKVGSLESVASFEFMLKDLHSPTRCILHHLYKTPAIAKLPEYIFSLIILASISTNLPIYFFEDNFNTRNKLFTLILSLCIIFNFLSTFKGLILEHGIGSSEYTAITQPIGAFMRDLEEFTSQKKSKEQKIKILNIIEISNQNIKIFRRILKEQNILKEKRQYIEQLIIKISEYKKLVERIYDTLTLNQQSLLYQNIKSPKNEKLMEDRCNKLKPFFEVQEDIESENIINSPVTLMPSPTTFGGDKVYPKEESKTLEKIMEGIQLQASTLNINLDEIKIKETQELELNKEIRNIENYINELNKVFNGQFREAKKLYENTLNELKISKDLKNRKFLLIKKLFRYVYLELKDLFQFGLNIIGISGLTMQEVTGKKLINLDMPNAQNFKQNLQKKYEIIPTFQTKSGRSIAQKIRTTVKTIKFMEYCLVYLKLTYYAPYTIDNTLQNKIKQWKDLLFQTIIKEEAYFKNSCNIDKCYHFNKELEQEELDDIKKYLQSKLKISKESKKMVNYQFLNFIKHWLHIDIADDIVLMIEMIKYVFGQKTILDTFTSQNYKIA